MKIKNLFIIITISYLNIISAGQSIWRQAGKKLFKNGISFIKNQSINSTKTLTLQIQERPLEATIGACTGGIAAYAFSGENDNFIIKAQKIATGSSLGLLVGLQRGSINSKLGTIFNEIKTLRSEQKIAFSELNNVIKQNFKETKSDFNFLLLRINRTRKVILGKLNKIQKNQSELSSKIDVLTSQQKESYHNLHNAIKENNSYTNRLEEKTALIDEKTTLILETIINDQKKRSSRYFFD